MKINLDYKSILIVFFIGFTIFFGFKWYFSIGDNDFYKSQVKELRKENKELQTRRDSLSKENIILSSKLDSIITKDSILSNEIEILSKDIEEYKKRSKISLRELNDIKKKLKESENKIKDFINNPPTKTEDEIIESLKKQLNL
jgi:chromosome segregation ATPase